MKIDVHQLEFIKDLNLEGYSEGGCGMGSVVVW